MENPRRASRRGFSVPWSRKGSPTAPQGRRAAPDQVVLTVRQSPLSCLHMVPLSVKGWPCAV